MTAYNAKFSDGTEISLKNSKREYAAAWKATATFSDRVTTVTGFSRDAELAHKAGRSETSRWGKVWDARRRKLVPGPNMPTVVVEVVEAIRS